MWLTVQTSMFVTPFAVVVVSAEMLLKEVYIYIYIYIYIA